MKIFISWSGQKSMALAHVLNDWIPAVIQAAKPYFSPEDIEKGARWSSDISKELEAASIGIICLTKSNLVAPWLMFEAGALAKSIDKARVVPLLFDVGTSELKGPLLQFQAASFNEIDIRKLVRTMNTALGESALDSGVLDSVFDKWWPELEDKINKILSEEATEPEFASRTDREILVEILELTRAGYYHNGADVDPKLLRPVDDLELSGNALGSLKAVNIYYIGDLIQRTSKELEKLGVPREVVVEIDTRLAVQALAFGMRFENWPPPKNMLTRQ